MAVNVPNAPGVPSVEFASGFGLALSFLTSDAASIFRGISSDQSWGIYLGGAPVVLADNVASFDYRQQWAVSDYPIEGGSFESYNKVQTPFDARFRFTAGGSESNREAMLASIAAIAGTTLKFDIVTPEAIYNNATITHYDYSRTSTNGLGLMIVDIWTQEVRENVVMSLSNSSTPEGSNVNNDGNVAPSPATAGEDTRREAIVDHRAGNLSGARLGHV